MDVPEKNKADRPRPPTLLDVAEAVGVSRTTVSNAFNRPDQLSAELREQVLAAAAAMGYPGPNPMARMLRKGRAGAVGLVFPDPLSYAFDDPVAIAFLKGVSAVCEQAEVGLLLLPGVGEAERIVQEAAVDGFIVYCMPVGSATVRAVTERRLPLVTVDQGPIGAFGAVGIDDRGGAASAARHLLGLGHRRFALVAMELREDGYAGPVDAARRSCILFEATRQRLLGYEDAFREAGLSPEAVPIEERRNSEHTGLEAGLALLQRARRPTAVLAMSDRLALGVLQAAEYLGLGVPGDLSVVGFDDIPLAARVRPALTTVWQPLAAKGEAAARLLLEEEPDDAVVFPTRLVVRDSTGPAPGA